MILGVSGGFMGVPIDFRDVSEMFQEVTQGFRSVVGACNVLQRHLGGPRGVQVVAEQHNSEWAVADYFFTALIARVTANDDVDERCEIKQSVSEAFQGSSKEFLKRSKGF